MEPIHLLVVEDDDVIRCGLVDTLAAQGYEVHGEASGRAALASAARFEPTLVVLDLGLPDIDGVEVCRRLRRHHPECVIVILTARREEIDAVLGLDAGADDYVTKPFRLAELLARVRAHLRRVAAETDEVRTVGPVSIDVAARRVAVDGISIELRPKEFELLDLLAREAGRVVTRERMMHEVWATDWMGSSKTLDVHMSSLRAKLGECGELITTLRGVGYRFEGS